MSVVAASGTGGQEIPALLTPARRGGGDRVVPAVEAGFAGGVFYLRSAVQ